MSDSIHAVAIPKWGIEMVEGTIASWLADVGGAVNKGDEIAEIESDKIVNTLEAPAGGVLRRRLVDEGDVATVGSLIGVIASAEADDAAIDAFIAAYQVPRHSGESHSTPAAGAQSSEENRKPAAETAARPRGRVSPVIKRRAKELGVDIESVTGTGANGRVTAEDVERAASGETPGAGTPSEPASTTPSVVTPLSSTRKTIARRLVQSKQTIPHFYLSTEIVIDRLVQQRAEQNQQSGQKLSLNDLLLVCAAGALMDVPGVNAHLLGDEIHQFQNANIAIAVATERGLITPVIRHAEQLSPGQIATETARLIGRARTGTLARDDVSNGTFSVSNLGMYGVTRFDAIINPPQVAILALGAASERPVVGAEGEFQVATVMAANLACDHRVVDGALGGQYLAALKRRIESYE